MLNRQRFAEPKDGEHSKFHANIPFEVTIMHIHTELLVARSHRHSELEEFLICSDSVRLDAGATGAIRVSFSDTYGSDCPMLEALLENNVNLHCCGSSEIHVHV